MRNSLIFTICSQIIVIVGAHILAIALEQKFPGRGLIRFLILLPWVAPIALGAIGWKWILDSIYSVITWVLVAMHIYKPFSAPMRAGEPNLAIASVLLVHSWRLLPFATVILLAGRTAIPKDIPEAAAVDGAGFWSTEFQIVIPMMQPIMSVAVLFGLIFTFTDMTVVYILTAGAAHSIPRRPCLISLLRWAFSAADPAAGAAISLFLVPVLAIIAYFMLRVANHAEVTRTSAKGISRRIVSRRIWGKLAPSWCCSFYRPAGLSFLLDVDHQLQAKCRSLHDGEQPLHL